jgi:hypothetical protein
MISLTEYLRESIAEKLMEVAALKPSIRSENSSRKWKKHKCGEYCKKVGVEPDLDYGAGKHQEVPDDLENHFGGHIERYEPSLPTHNEDGTKNRKNNVDWNKPKKVVMASNVFNTQEANHETHDLHPDLHDDVVKNGTGDLHRALEHIKHHSTNDGQLIANRTSTPLFNPNLTHAVFHAALKMHYKDVKRDGDVYHASNPIRR